MLIFEKNLTSKDLIDIDVNDVKNLKASSDFIDGVVIDES